MVKSALEVMMAHPGIDRTWALSPTGAVDWPSLSMQPDSLLWNEEWIKRYSVEPLWSNTIEQAGVEQALSANVWVAVKRIREGGIKLSKLNTKTALKENLIPSRDERPLGNHLLMTGLIATVSGIPLDFGFPSSIDVTNHVIKALTSEDGS